MYVWGFVCVVFLFSPTPLFLNRLGPPVPFSTFLKHSLIDRLSTFREAITVIASAARPAYKESYFKNSKV